MKPPQIDKKRLQKLLHKIALKRFYDNITKVMEDNRIKHKQLSTEGGRNDGAFNKSYNRLEDMKLTSFLRYWHTLCNLVPEFHESLDFQSLFDNQVSKTLSVAAELSIFEPDEMAKREKEFFIGLKGYVEGFVNTGVYKANSIEVRTYHAFMSRYIHEEDTHV